MDTGKEARRILDDAEHALRKLIGQCMERQEYSQIPPVARLADSLTRLQGSIDSSSPVDFVRLPADPHSPYEQSQARPAKPALGRKRQSMKPTREYPRFERDGDKLVKVGWSKKHKSSYEHRAQKEVVVAFSRHLVSRVPDNRVFALEDLLPVPDPANNGEIPAYQVYLALAWLRDIGAIVKKGKDGYVWNRGALAAEDFEKFWAEIPQHR